MKTCTIFAAALAFGLVQSAALDLRSVEDRLSAEGKRDNGGDVGEWHEYADTPLGKVYSNVARDLHNFKREESTTWHEYGVTPLGKVYSNVARDISGVQDINPDNIVDEVSTRDSLSARDSTDDVIQANFLKAHPDIGNDPQAIGNYIATHPELKAALEASKPHIKRDLIAESAALQRRDRNSCIACFCLCVLSLSADVASGVSSSSWTTILGR
ncbi:MAG: hypothetical protein M1836_000051 [Candelina mexicana]|nr:MAG: hypothetical protein M1836_000051 [Candelina mexicana]